MLDQASPVFCEMEAPPRESKRRAVSSCRGFKAHV